MMPDEIVDKALKYDLDQAGIERRAAEAVELVEARARIAELEEYSERCRLGGMKLAAALSRIDYLCGPPNEMEVSSYDVHCNENAVVEVVSRLKAKTAELEAENKRLREELEATKKGLTTLQRKRAALGGEGRG